MEPNVLPYIIAGIALVIGIIAGKFIFSKNTKRLVEEAEERANKIISVRKIKIGKITRGEREIRSIKGGTR